LIFKLFYLGTLHNSSTTSTKDTPGLSTGKSNWLAKAIEGKKGRYTELDGWSSLLIIFIGKDSEDKNQSVKEETRKSRSMEGNKDNNGVDWVCCMHPNAAQYHPAADNRTQCTDCTHNRCANCPKVVALLQGTDLVENLLNHHPRLRTSGNEFYSVSWVCFRPGCLKLRQCTCLNSDRRIVLLLH
jgi:hypothetical protein